MFSQHTRPGGPLNTDTPEMTRLGDCQDEVDFSDSGPEPTSKSLLTLEQLLTASTGRQW